MRKNKKVEKPDEIASSDDYIYYCTFYEMEEYRISIHLLSQNGIDFKVLNKSNPINYRIPSSTYSEIGLYIHLSCYEEADKLLKSIRYD